MSITQIVCKDCGASFYYGDDARRRDLMAGRTSPERCPHCRAYHRREYSALGCSHADVLQLRTDGTGGLSHYVRPREKPKVVETEPLKIESFPIEEIIGSRDQPGSLLHGLLRGDKRVHLVVGPTGSGKSTWLPFRLVSCTDLVRKGPICVTQPRIPATEGPAGFVGKLYYGENVDLCVGPGLVVGYRHSEVGKSKTDAANRLIFMTDGTLLNELVSGEVGKYSVVMIDEAHERSVNIDLILSLLKVKLLQFSHLHVIIASATVDASGFETFFGGPDQVARYESGGFTYPILDVFADETVTHWPGFSSPDDPFASFWREMDPNVAQAEWLGPLPCLFYTPMDRYRLRRHPQFEALVFQGVMTEEERAQLLQSCADSAWREGIERLYSESRRQRMIGAGKSVSVTESIRGPLSGKPNEFPVRVQPALTDRLLHAAVDVICQLVARDEDEAVRRIGRWENRASYGWNKLKRPGACGHIIAFFPTTSAIDRCHELLLERLPSLPGVNHVHRFHREVSTKEKEAVTAESSSTQPVRKIILGTNLAETSLTLDGLVYVVDTGLICETYYNPQTKTNDYPTILHSHAGCRQRLGRVGRKEPGEGYRLYTREELKRHPAYTTPQITRSSPEQLLLCFASAGLPPAFSARSGALMQPPPKKIIETAQRELGRLQALDADGDLTPRGSELLRIGGNSLIEGVLLCEADRFGCLWEMAILLSFLTIPDRSLSDGQGKWLSLWDPASGGVYEDQMGEETPELASDEEDAGAESQERQTRDLWLNPYWKGNVFVKQQALRDGVLDDLELYLRIWQAWFSNDGEENRRLWAQEHGVSHEALRHVERKLGLDPDDAAERGMLRTFWAFDQKGIMTRDVHFEALDKVRYLYAAAVPDRIYRRSDAGEIRPQVGGSKFPIETVVHPESVWAEHSTWTSVRYGEIARLSCFAANARTVRRKKGMKTTLRHIVWLDPEWMEPSLPSFSENTVALARRFAPFAERYLACHGQWPFAGGDQACGLRWPIPSVPLPSPLQVTQWKVRFGSAVKLGNRLQAEAAQVVAWPHFIRKLVFLHLPSGPLLPMELPPDIPVPCIGEKLEVILIEKDGFLWAQLPKSKGSEEPLPEAAPPEPASENVHEIPPQAPERKLCLVSPSRPASPEPCRPAPPPPPPVDLRAVLPLNAVVEARFVSFSASGKNQWFNVSVPLPGHSREEKWAFPIFNQRTLERLQSEATPGRFCLLKIKNWEEKSGKLRPRLHFEGWVL